MTKLLWLMFAVLFVSKLAGWITASWWLILVPAYVLLAVYLFWILVFLVAIITAAFKSGDE